jgi:hypothetical protein
MFHVSYVLPCPLTISAAWQNMNHFLKLVITEDETFKTGARSSGIQFLLHQQSPIQLRFVNYTVSSARHAVAKISVGEM